MKNNSGGQVSFHKKMTLIRVTVSEKTGFMDGWMEGRTDDRLYAMIVAQTLMCSSRELSFNLKKNPSVSTRSTWPAAKIWKKSVREIIAAWAKGVIKQGSLKKRIYDGIYSCSPKHRRLVSAKKFFIHDGRSGHKHNTANTVPIHTATIN